MELESKHIAPYLPYGLKVIHERHVKEVHGLMNEEIYLDYNGIGTDMSGKELFEVKPILLPLSALTEPLKDGSIPIVELAKIAESQHFNLPLNVKHDEVSNVSLCEFYSKETGEFILFCYIHNQNAFYLRSEKRGDALVMVNQLQLFEYLFANHFDVFNLISCQLADAK